MNSADRQRVVIVTGGSRGLGKDIALAFGRAGDRVIVNFISSERDADAVVNDIIHTGGEAVTSRADVRISREVESMMQNAMQLWGSVDVLVNNAGVTKDGLMLRLSEPDWDSVIDTNLKGAFHAIRAASKIMIRQKSGHIINISSIVGAQGREGQAHYASSKAGLVGLTKAAALELGRRNVKVNAVLPGYLPTDMGKMVSEKMQERVVRENALGRVSDPREVAEFICQLSRMNNVSGQVFNLDSRIL
jgi:3-oxoacyl-[acyl-carrier protein] reductase